MFLEESKEVKKKYKHKYVTADEAVRIIKSGDRVYIHPGCAFPEILVDAMARRKEELYDVEVCHLLGIGNVAYAKPEMEGHFRHNAYFIGQNVRNEVKEGRADFTPIFLSEVPWLIKSRKVDVALIQVSPPDKTGFCSFGTGVETTKAATEVARHIIAQINPNAPRVYGDSFIHISKIEYCVEVDVPLNELPMGDGKNSKEETDIFQKIGENVAELVEDGATLQMGIGAVPNAVLTYLDYHKDLGIHSEMFSDGLIPLVEKGIINGEKKTLLPGKIVASFVLGTRKVFDFIDNNPEVEFRPTEFVNDPFTIARNKKMTAINSALQIDLTGQVCSDSIGYTFYSGFGGQVDFLRGAAKSDEGKPIITLPATAKKGTISRIVPHLDEGAGVTDSRADVHYVVTEYGVANLHGKTIRERAKMIIKLAHPQFREELEKFAKEHHYI
jgi:acyl-CoA hydrolase